MIRSMLRKVVSAPFLELNTWIGGVASTIPDAATLASLTPWDESDILNFTLDGFGNIGFFLNRNWGNIAFSSTPFFFSNSNVTFIISDADFNILATSTPRNLPNCIAIEVNALSVTGGSNFRDILNTEVRMPLANYSVNSFTFRCLNLYLPSTSKLGATTAVDGFFGNNPNQGTKLYVNEAAETNNSGGIEGDIDIAINTHNWDVRFINNFTPPSAITDLSASNITSTSVDLNFTPPSSTNALDFYEVYIDDGTGNFRQLKVRWQRITGSGSTISNLITGTTYKIKVIACDEFWNRSEFSNEIEITTL